jgi:hypothetical protein
MPSRGMLRQPCDDSRKIIHLGTMNRSVTRTGRLSEQSNDDFVPGSPASRIQLVWILTREAASLSRWHDAERRLQRDVAVLGRGRG